MKKNIASTLRLRVFAASGALVFASLAVGGNLALADHYASAGPTAPAALVAAAPAGGPAAAQQRDCS